ncbi:MAG: glutamate racemase [Clostridiales bacterium]|nr:glutamate racemase [Clostridiales bacterium]
MSSRQDPVGVFDSGVGGISALQAMMRLLPGERFIYYGDTVNAPYGTKSSEEVLSCVRIVVDRLLAQGIKALVIACNTATGAAAAPLRRELDIPVIGMEPALKPASEVRKDGKILVLATPLTLEQEKFRQLMDKYGEGAEKVPCPGLMELVEHDDTAASRAYLRDIFSRYDMDRVDAIVLGCTHYVFLKDMIREMVPPGIAITEGSEGTARQLRRVLQRNGLLAEGTEGGVTLQTSGSENDIRIMKRLLQVPLQ